MRTSSEPQRNCPKLELHVVSPVLGETTHASCAGSGWPVLPSLTGRANGVSLVTYLPLSSRRRRAWLEGLCSTRDGTLREAPERALPPAKPWRRSQALSDTSAGTERMEMDVRRLYGLPSMPAPFRIRVEGYFETRKQFISLRNIPRVTWGRCVAGA